MAEFNSNVPLRDDGNRFLGNYLKRLMLTPATRSGDACNEWYLCMLPISYYTTINGDEIVEVEFNS